MSWIQPVLRISDILVRTKIDTKKNFQLYFFSSVFGHQNPGSGLDPDLFEMLVRIRINNSVLGTTKE